MRCESADRHQLQHQRRRRGATMPLPWAFTLVLLLLVRSISALHDDLLDDEAFRHLNAADKEEMRKRELENCVPHDVRSFLVGARAVVEWSSRRTYIPTVHASSAKNPHNPLDADPWQACRDDGAVEVRYRLLGRFDLPFQAQPAITYAARGANVTAHTAWVTLEDASQAYEFMVGSTFHGWSNVQRLGDNLLLTTPEQIACHPKHVHTAYGHTADSFSVQWMTMGACTRGQQQLKLVAGHRQRVPRSLPATATAETTLFVDDGPSKILRRLHVVTLTGLATNARFTYTVGSDAYTWSIPYSTRTAPSVTQVAQALPQRFLITGDIGYQNAATLPMMQSEVAEGAVDAVVSMGDYAYDLHLAEGRVGDIFMEEFEPIAAAVPFMVAPGNHETFHGFAHYSQRFRNMPSNTGTVLAGARHARGQETPNNWFYSFNVGLVHFVVLSTEIYFKKTPHEPRIVARMEQWLQEDLLRANSQRDEQPWVIVLGHRPMYCTSDAKNCGKKAALLRDRLEDTFHAFGVDLYICGHQHNYERAFDVYRSQTQRRTTNMRATTHILTGASGQYQLSIMRKDFELPVADWDAFRNSIFGYSRLQVFNATHLRWQQVESDPQNPAAHGLYGAVADDVWLVQEHHGSFAE